MNTKFSVIQKLGRAPHILKMFKNMKETISGILLLYQPNSEFFFTY